MYYGPSPAPTSVRDYLQVILYLWGNEFKWSLCFLSDTYVN